VVKAVLRCIFRANYVYLSEFMQISAAIIANLLQGEIIGNPEVQVSSPAGIEQAREDQISFLGNLKYENHLYTTRAGIVIVPSSLKLKQSVETTLIKVKDVYAALAELFSAFSPKIELEPGISNSAIIAAGALVSMTARIEDGAIIEEGAVIGDKVRIGAQVYIGKNSVVGDHTILHPGVKIYRDCVIGRNCLLHSNAVIGSDGFGFAKRPDQSFIKIPHLGGVLIGDDVEIGANTTIDRGSMGNTEISNGVKIDNLVHIAHNVHIGEGTAIAAQAGIAGSTEIGAHCMIGGQVGISGHLKIADGTQIQAQSGVASSVTKINTRLFGTPAIDYNHYTRSYVLFKNLSDIWKRLRDLEKKIN